MGLESHGNRQLQIMGSAPLNQVRRGDVIRCRLGEWGRTCRNGHSGLLTTQPRRICRPGRAECHLCPATPSLVPFSELSHSSFCPSGASVHSWGRSKVGERSSWTQAQTCPFRRGGEGAPWPGCTSDEGLHITPVLGEESCVLGQGTSYSLMGAGKAITTLCPGLCVQY